MDGESQHLSCPKPCTELSFAQQPPTPQQEALPAWFKEPQGGADCSSLAAALQQHILPPSVMWIEWTVAEEERSSFLPLRISTRFSSLWPGFQISSSGSLSGQVTAAAAGQRWRGRTISVCLVWDRKLCPWASPQHHSASRSWLNPRAQQYLSAAGHTWVTTKRKQTTTEAGWLSVCWKNGKTQCKEALQEMQFLENYWKGALTEPFLQWH